MGDRKAPTPPPPGAIKPDPPPAPPRNRGGLRVYVGLTDAGEIHFETVGDDAGDAIRGEIFKDREDAIDRFRRVALAEITFIEIPVRKGGRI